MQLKEYNKNIKKLENWLNKKNFDLILSSKSSDIVFNSKFCKCVEINTSFSYKNQIFALLHECGHILVQSRSDYDLEFNSDFICTNKNNILYRYDTIKEELYAWEAGLKLSKRLNIKIDDNEYRKNAWKWLSTYMIELTQK